MKICIPIKYQPRGGMYSFIQNFIGYMECHGIAYTDDINESYDILFVNSFMVDYNLIKRVKKRRGEVRVVQRVDGSARDYGRYDDADNRQARVNMLTDLTIFQSRYSIYSTREKFKVIFQDGPIIYNAVDTNLFSPEGGKIDLPHRVKVCHVNFSPNPKKGLSMVYEVAAAHLDIDFILCGPQDDSRHLPNIHPQGYLERKELPQVMRSCDVFFHPALNDPCPNVVLEGLASGLPVLYKDSGGTPELVGECGLPVEAGNFREQLERVLTEREEFSRAARARAVEHFSPEIIFPQYLEAMERVEPRPLPAAADFIRVWRQGYPVLPYPSYRLIYNICRMAYHYIIQMMKKFKTFMPVKQQKNARMKISKDRQRVIYEDYQAYLAHQALRKNVLKNDRPIFNPHDHPWIVKDLKILYEFIKPHHKILDVGCRSGWSCLRMIHDGYPNVIGIDVQSDNIEYGLAMGAPVELGDAHNLKYYDESFDVVFIRSSLEHMFDPVQVIEEAHRVLKKGGLLFINVPLEPEGIDDFVHAHSYIFDSENRLLELISAFNTVYFVNKDGQLIYIGERKKT